MPGSDASRKVDVCVIGAGPAGLAAAEVAGAAGLSVMVADAMPSVGRKFLMAGKSGLNLTKAEPDGAFRAAFSHPAQMAAALDAFGPDDVIAWANDLGQDTFVGSTGRVFPKVMKASPLLRAWLARCVASGVRVQTRWRWQGWQDGGKLIFATPDGPVSVTASAVVLALGGASWRRLGSDGAWTALLDAPTMPFRPANVGFDVDWSPHMAAQFGQPVKGTELSAGGLSSRGEWIVSRRGIEGGGVYEVSRAVRDGADLFVDFFPDVALESLAAKLARPRGKKSVTDHLRRVLSLDGVRRALVLEWARPLPDGPALASRLKAVPVPIAATRPMDEAISVAGGLAWSALTPDLMLKARPGVFAAGEMLDWEAPTGGYLITGCLATGRLAGRAAANWVTAARKGGIETGHEGEAP